MGQGPLMEVIMLELDSEKSASSKVLHERGLRRRESSHSMVLPMVLFSIPGQPDLTAGISDEASRILDFNRSPEASLGSFWRGLCLSPRLWQWGHRYIHPCFFSIMPSISSSKNKHKVGNAWLA